MLFGIALNLVETFIRFKYYSLETILKQGVSTI